MNPYYVRFRIDGRRQRNRSLGTNDPREAKRLLLEMERELERHNTAEVHVTKVERGEDPRIEVFWKWFQDWAKESRSTRAVEEYANWWQQLTDFAGPTNLSDITVSTAEDFKKSLLKQGKRKAKGEGLKKASINNALKTLQAIWNIAIRCEKYAGPNPFAKIERFKIPKQEDQGYLEKDDVEALLKAALDYAKLPSIKRVEARNVYVAIALMAYAGLRRAEVCWLRWDDIDFDKRIITVVSHDEFQTKNRQLRRVPINDSLLEILSAYDERDGFVLATTRQTEESYRYRADFKRSFEHVCELAEIKTTRHNLRHSFISRHANAGTPLHKIAGWVGHSTTWITERYSHYQQEFDESANNI
jgi:integrase